MDFDDLAVDLEAHVDAARKAGDVTALLAVATPALDRLIAGADAAPQIDHTEALKAAQRIGYNAGADLWPGWELGTGRTSAELAAGRHLAEQSSAIVERLNQGPMQRGNAAWLVGAYDLAQGDDQAALEKFRTAAEFFAEDRNMRLLAEGYVAIAEERMGKPPALAAIIAALDELATDDAAFMRDQLLVARKVFAGHAGAV